MAEEQVLITLTEADLEKIRSNPVGAKQTKANLKKALVSETDPEIRRIILAQLKQVESIISAQIEMDQKNKAREQNPDPEEDAKKQNETTSKKPDDKTIEKEAEEFVQAREKLFATIDKHLDDGKINAVGKGGIEIPIDSLKNGFPKDVIGFAGQDKEAVAEVAQGVGDLFDKIPQRTGCQVVKKEVTRNGESFFFYATLMMEAISEGIDPFSITAKEIVEVSEEVAAASKKQPNPSVARSFSEEQMGLDHFKKNHLGRTFAVATGSNEELDKFHEEQVVELWKSFSKDRKEKSTDSRVPEKLADIGRTAEEIGNSR